jgi:ribosomal protein S6--L-glutamate ligase
MILSFHPLYQGDVNRLCAGRDPDAQDRAAMRQAAAVILPQGCRASLYQAATRACGRVFPNYEARFAYPGKLGQIRLFQETGVPHPPSFCFADTAAFLQNDPAGNRPVSPPAVVKLNWGGEGRGVFPITQAGNLREIITLLQSYETTGQSGFIIQEWIPAGARALRVVVTGRELFSYWRVMASENAPLANLACGGAIDHGSDGHLMAAAEKATTAFCRKTGINLAGFDFLFCTDPAVADPQTPLFLEINYFFGRRGLWGSEAYYQRLQRAIDHWLEKAVSPVPPVPAQGALSA